MRRPTETLQATAAVFVYILYATSRTSAADSGCGNNGDIHWSSLPPNMTSGSLTSHSGYGRAAAPREFCEWVITPPIGRYVSLTVHDMGNISCHTQLFVYTYLNDDRYPGWNLCPQGFFPLDGTPYHLASSRSQWLRVHYRGNKFPDQTTGFSASYAFREPGCNGHQELAGDPWYFVSHPGAQVWAVEAGSTCTWTLTAPEGQYVGLIAGDVDLHCVAGWQTLAIYDSDKPRSNSLIVVLTCTNQISPLAATGRHLHLSYTDRWASHSVGFNISYSFYPMQQSGCGSFYHMNTPIGEITSFRLPGYKTYTPLSRCRWRITAPPGVQLALRFTAFDVTPRYTEGSCSRDVIVLRELTKDNSTSSVHIYCNGPAAPHGVIKPNQQTVEMFFSTESLSKDYLQGTGFLLHFTRTCAPDANSMTVIWTSKDENNDGISLISVRETVDYSCAEGFVVSSGDSSRTCGDNSKMTGQRLVCEPVRCVDIPRPVFTLYETLDVNMDGHDVLSYKDVIRYTCIRGYVATGDGDTERSCQSDGTLSGTDLVCQVKHCGPYPTLQYSTALPMDSGQDGSDIVTYGEVVVYTCHHGYTELSGSSLRSCQEDGTYSGQDLICAPRQCPLLELSTGFAVQTEDQNSDGPTRISYKETVVYECLPGFIYASGDHVRTCMAEGILNGTQIVCQAKVCSEWPAVGMKTTRKAGADRNLDGADIVSYSETLVYGCRPGYKPSGGDIIRVCMKNGTFNGMQLKCVADVAVTANHYLSSLSKPTVISTAVCLSLLILLLVLIVSILAARRHGLRHDVPVPLPCTSDGAKSKPRRCPTPASHHALTLHRVATPWDGLQLRGHILNDLGNDLNGNPDRDLEGLMVASTAMQQPRGMAGYFRWPMYLWEYDEPKPAEAIPRTGSFNCSVNADSMGQTDMEGTASPLTC